MNPSNFEQLKLFAFYCWALRLTAADLNNIYSKVGEFHHTLDNVVMVLGCYYNNIPCHLILQTIKNNGFDI